MSTAPAIDPGPAHGTQQAAHFDTLLEESRKLICERLDSAVAVMLDDAKTALTTLIDDTRKLDDRRLYEEARQVVVTQRDIIEKQFRAGYLAEFRKRGDRARKAGQVFEDSDDALHLELVGEDDYDETLKFNKMAAKLRAYCDEELVALDQRVGVLLGDANVQANDNPFSPQVICDAYKQACRRLDTSARVRRVLLKLFDDHVLDDVRSMYKAVNALLVQNSILPKIRYSVARSPDRKAQAREETPGETPAADPATPGGVPTAAGATTMTRTTTATGGAPQDLFSILQNLVSNNAAATGQPGAGGAGAPLAPGAVGVPAMGGAAGAQVASGGAAPPLQGPELMGTLTRIQLGDLNGVANGSAAGSSGVPGATNVLHGLKTSSVGAGMGPMDHMTLDIVAMLFDQLFDDPKVPNGVKGLIGRMQIPMLKVAITDKSFFSTKTHPARRLLDTLGEIAARLPADFSPADPLFERVQGILEELVAAFQDKMDIFTSVRERLEALLSEEDQRIEQESLAQAKRMEEMETLAIAKRSAAEEIKTRVQAYKLPPPVLDFLAQQWLKFLLLLHVQEGRESAAWKRAVETMDQLIWSVSPKNTREERRELVALIPGLVRHLAVGLRAAGVDDAVRAQFFSRLMKLHRQGITAPVEGKPDSASSAQAGKSPAETRAAPDFSAPITVRNPFGEGDVSVEGLDLDFTAVEAGSSPAQRSAIAADPMESLVVGTWVEFRETAEERGRRRGKLIFVTPRKTRYLFAFDRAGKDVLPYSPGELSRRFRIGESVLINEPREEGLFDRIMKGLVGKLRAASVR